MAAPSAKCAELPRRRRCRRSPQRRAEEAARAEWAAKVAQHKIAQATPQTHPYLERKGFPKTLGLVHEGWLLVPARIDGPRGVAAGDRATTARRRTCPAAG